MILGSCGESGRYIEVRLGLTYQFGVALVPLVLRPGIASVEALVEERNDVSETLLREPFRITHDEGGILEAVGLFMPAYTIIEYQTNGVVIGFGVLRRIISAIRDRHGDDHRIGVRGDRHVDVVLKAHLQTYAVEIERVGNRFMARISVIEVERMLAAAHRVFCPDGRYSRRNDSQTGVDEMMASVVVGRRVLIVTRLGVHMFADKERVADTDRVVVDLVGRIEDGEVQLKDRIAAIHGCELVCFVILTRSHVLVEMSAPLQRLIGAEGEVFRGGVVRMYAQLGLVDRVAPVDGQETIP